MKHRATTTREVKDLIGLIASFDNEKETQAFLTDLLTEKELLEFSRRWKAAQLLHNGVPYTEIVEQTGLSSTTVARISKWLQDGAGGYKMALNRLSGKNSR